MRRAVVIGCGRYDDEEIPDLRHAAADAMRFAAVLVESCRLNREDIVVLADDESDERRLPTRDNVIRALTHGRRYATKGLQTLFFFFSGHRVHSADHGTDFLLPRGTNQDEIEYTGVAFQKISEW